MNDFFVSQQEIAENFGVNRTTVRAWTKAGLPYLKADQGKQSGYHIGHTIWWTAGRRHFETMEYEKKTSALEKIMLARLLVAEENGIEANEDVEREEKFIEGLLIYGFSKPEVEAAKNKMAGFLMGWIHAVSIRRTNMHARSDEPT